MWKLVLLVQTHAETKGKEIHVQMWLRHNRRMSRVVSLHISEETREEAERACVVCYSNVIPPPKEALGDADLMHKSFCPRNSISIPGTEAIASIFSIQEAVST